MTFTGIETTFPKAAGRAWLPNNAGHSAASPALGSSPGEHTLLGTRTCPQGNALWQGQLAWGRDFIQSNQGFYCVDVGSEILLKFF